MQSRRTPDPLAARIGIIARSLAACQLLLFLAAAPRDALGAEQWIKLTTPHFEMYTANSKSKSLDVLEMFEQARAFFKENSPSKAVPDGPIRIVVFRSAKQYRPYSVNPGSAAYYQHTRERDYIVMQEINPAFYAAAIHEYTHLFIDHLDLALPLWLNEGLADVYSSMQLRGSELMIGVPPAGRLEALRTYIWLSLPQLFAVDQHSSYYTQPDRMALFYAESWALAHMLLLGREYRPHFTAFLSELSERTGERRSFADVYHKNLSEVAQDLHQYVSRKTIAVSLFDSHFNGRNLALQVSRVAPLQVEVVLADLLASHEATASEGKARLMRLATQMPSNAEVQESLAYVAWREGKLQAAKEHFDRALKDGSKDPYMMYQYARLLRTTAAPYSKVVNLLQQAIAMKPDLTGARLELALEAASQNQCALALSSLAPIKVIDSDHAFPFYSVYAYCEDQLGDVQQSRRLGELARKYAKTPEQRASADTFLEQLR